MCEKSSNKLTSLKDLKDCESINDIDLEKVDLIRGEIPNDIKQKCLQLCKDYLSANWRQQTVDTIEVQRISGGMTNQLYFCGITNPDINSKDVPQEVAIRLYGRKHINQLDCDGNERLTDVVIALMVSQNKLGPKIYGLFEGGQIQPFYKHRQFRVKEQKDPKLMVQLFQKLARVHAMEVPIKKSHWFFKDLDYRYEAALKTPINELSKEFKLETLLKYDLKSEIDWIKDIILKTNSPLVFCHNDFRGCNVLVLDNNNNNDTTGADEELVLCDYEYSSYGYRGHDFGSIICEWGRGMNDMIALHVFPSNSTLIPLINIYIEESKRIFGKKFTENKINSLDQILKELKVFSLSSTLFTTVFLLNRDENSKNTYPMGDKIMLGYAEVFYKNYWHLKTQFMQQNIFQ